MSNKVYKVCIIGLEHVHAPLLYNAFQNDCKDCVEWIGYAQVSKQPEEVYQVDPSWYQRIFDNMKEYDNYLDLLDQKPDIALVCTDIKTHAEICEETLRRNIHTVVEKPMALTVSDAVRMYRAAQQSNAELVINWPIAWFPAFNKVKELADSGIVGDTLRVTYRTPSTRGPFNPDKLPEEILAQTWWYHTERGGGSLMDYAGYGCVLSAWLVKEELPLRAAGFRKNFMMPFMDAEDYSACLLEYQNAVASVEGSWSTGHSGAIPTGPLVYGTEGTIVADRYSSSVKVYRSKNGKDAEPEVFEVPKGGTNIGLNFLNHLDDGSALHEMITLEFNMRAMTMLDACRRAAQSGTVVSIQKEW